MAIPIIIGAAALAAAAFGAKKGYDGYQKKSEADEIVDAAKKYYESRKESLDEQEKETLESLSSLGKLEIEIGTRFNEFTILADDILEKINKTRNEKKQINIPKHQLQKIENYSISTIGVIGTVAGAGAAGAAAGFAVYGGVMALGAASTGTAISSLAGVAATNATLAAIGGGSLATGGLGIAGGTAILGGAIAGPLVAIAGWAYDSHAEEALKNARKIQNEVEAAVKKINTACRHMYQTNIYAHKIKDSLIPIYEQFSLYFDQLKGFDQFIVGAKNLGINSDEQINGLSDQIYLAIQNGWALAAILTDIITTPIFKIKKTDGTVNLNKDGIPEMELDGNGLTIVNNQELDSVMQKGEVDASSIQG